MSKARLRDLYDPVVRERIAWMIQVTREKRQQPKETRGCVMTIQFACLLAGMLLPLIWAGVSVPYRTRQLGSVDLNSPREQATKLVEAGARVVGAQSNAWEALAIFTVANFMAVTAGVDPGSNWALACMVWVAARIGHGVAYVAGQAILRVLSFVVSLLMCLWIVAMAFSAA